MEIRIKRVCIVVLLIFLSIFFGIYLILASFDQIILQNYVEEFKKSYALQPISIGMLKQTVTSVLENKMCSKFKQPVSSFNNFNTEKVVYCILLCIFCILLGFIGGIQKSKKYVYYNEQNIQNGMLSSYSFDDNDQPSTCSLCLNVFKPNIVLLPCKHICICSSCWVSFYQGSTHNCPICRENIVEVMDVFST